VPEGLKYDLFDFAVNSGPSRAKKMLQRTVGAEEDGASGPKSLLLINSMNIWELRFKYMAHRMIVMKGSSNLRDSAGGWLARLSSIALEV
jgi:lysozyme family protein